MLGEIVLVDIGAGEKRPLLVQQQAGSAVNGVIFFQPYDRSDWVMRHFAYPPSSENFVLYIAGVAKGTGVGQWQPKQQPVQQQAAAARGRR